MQRLKDVGKNFIREFASKVTRFKLIPPSSTRENKISITIRVKNEIDWIEYCILSFKDFADEILIADNGSTDGSVQFIKKIMETHPEMPIKFWDRGQDTYLEVSNFLLKKARYRWIMRVDADHIAKTSGKYNIMKLKKRILQLDSYTYYGIRLGHVFLFMDLFHSQKDRPRHKETWIFTYSPDLVCYREGWYTDLFWMPLYYKIIEFNEPFVFHLFIRPKLRLLERKYWGDWRQKGSIIPLSQFISQAIKRDFSTDSLEIAADKNLKEHLKTAERYNPNKDDGYPKVLKKLLENPKYKIIYDENGKIIDRIESNHT